MTNKTNIISIATLLLAGATLAGVSNVHAADTDATANKLGETTTADFTVNPGYLTLDKAPSFHFGTIEVANLAGAHLSDGAAADNTLKITDQRGVTGKNPNTWNLSATLGAFKTGSGDDATSTTGKITLAGDNITTTGTTPSGTLTDTAASVWNSQDAGVTNGSGTATATFGKDAASLTLDSTNGVSNGAYKADITWTLTSTTPPVTEG